MTGRVSTNSTISFPEAVRLPAKRSHREIWQSPGKPAGFRRPFNHR